MRQASVLIALGLFVMTTAADAQTAQYGDRAVVVTNQLPTRINVGFNISQRVSGNSLDEQRRVDQALRRRLYQLAMQECALLIEVIGGECRIVSMNVNSNIQDNNEFHTVNGSMNGQYEITPRL
jgi:hypothetical protein